LGWLPPLLPRHPVGIPPSSSDFSSNNAIAIWIAVSMKHGVMNAPHRSLRNIHLTIHGHTLPASSWSNTLHILLFDLLGYRFPEKM
jgi:hypothetical protein